MAAQFQRHLLRCLFALLAGLCAHAFAQSEVRSVTVDGTSFRVQLTDGKVLASSGLVGAVLDLDVRGRKARVRIDAVERDPAVRNAQVWLHSFSVQQETGGWKNLCTPGPDGRSQGFPLAGRSRLNGTLAPADNATFELACTSGVQAKCVRFGYAPWSTAPDGSSLQAAHDACVAMLRADYGADGRPATREGNRIGITDRWDIKPPGESDPGYAFEAGWDEQGAVCVHHPRIRSLATLAQVERRAARLRGRTGEACTPEWARANGALVFNWSRP